MCCTATLKMYKAKVGQGMVEALWFRCKNSDTHPLMTVLETCEQVACPRSKLGQGEARLPDCYFFTFHHRGYEKTL